VNNVDEDATVEAGGWAWKRRGGSQWEGPTDILAEESDQGASIPKVIGSPPITVRGGGSQPDVLLLPYWREHPVRLCTQDTLGMWR